MTDFIDFHVGSFTWPTFNLADSAITVGVGLLLLGLRFGSVGAGRPRLEGRARDEMRG